MSDRRGEIVVNQTDRRRFDQLQADRNVIDTAAAWLREQAWLEQYAGLHDKDRAFMLAAVLDSVSVQLDRIPDGLRREVVRSARWLLGDRAV